MALKPLEDLHEECQLFLECCTWKSSCFAWHLHGCDPRVLGGGGRSRCLREILLGLRSFRLRAVGSWKIYLKRTEWFEMKVWQSWGLCWVFLQYDPVVYFSCWCLWIGSNICQYVRQRSWILVCGFDWMLYSIPLMMVVLWISWPLKSDGHIKLGIGFRVF